MSKLSFEEFIVNVGLAEAQKMNTCHDNLGQFCSRGGGGGEVSNPYVPGVTKISLRKNITGTSEEGKLITNVQSRKEHLSDSLRAAKAPKSTSFDWVRLEEARKKLYEAEKVLYNFRNSQ